MAAEILKIILGILGGALLTSWGYTLAFSAKMASMQTNLQNINTQVNKPIVLPADVTEKITMVCTQYKDLDDRVRRLEAGNDRRKVNE